MRKVAAYGDVSLELRILPNYERFLGAGGVIVGYRNIYPDTYTQMELDTKIIQAFGPL